MVINKIHEFNTEECSTDCNKDVLCVAPSSALSSSYRTAKKCLSFPPLMVATKDIVLIDFIFLFLFVIIT